jgi:ubiquinone/menaquinone biosynthesis C-methylase UbiE
MRTLDQGWPLFLFSKSVIKQNKYKHITSLLGNTNQLHCLDIGADNGVISLLFRQRGGIWKSADLDDQSISAIRDLVESGVYQIDGQSTPFQNNEFDRVIIVDFLEHIPNDAEFIKEIYRILKPGGELIVNTPHIKNSLLRKLRLALGQTDEKHGHLRPGYTINSLKDLLGEMFTVRHYRTYSKFFSELIDTLVVQAVYYTQRNKQEHSKKGALVTGKDFQENRLMFLLYSLIYPFIWLFSKLDVFLFFSDGYMLVAKVSVRK